MAPLGPFSAERAVMVAVSGGADSLALAWLAARWGRARAVIVDHGLRAESAQEATLTARRLAGFGVPAIILAAGLAPGSSGAERAREARFRLLLQACRDAGCADLLLAHHAADQAETVQMRLDAGSAPFGLAGMAAVAFRDEARLLRPLLPVASSRLRATLREAGLGWVDDPSNHDLRSPRARLRATMDAADVQHALALGAGHGVARARAERELAAELAGVEFHPSGYALVGEALSPAALSAVIWMVSGQRYPPPRAALSAGLATRSAHGVLLRPAGRLGPGVLVTREPAAVAVAQPARPGERWDGRFRIRAVPEGLAIGALGDDAARIGRRGEPPSIVRRTLPALRRDGKLVAVPHLGFPDAARCRSVSIVFSPQRPAAGAPFVNPSAGKGM